MNVIADTSLRTVPEALRGAGEGVGMPFRVCDGAPGGQQAEAAKLDAAIAANLKELGYGG